MKRENIIEAAIKRFSHFGIQKTTLGEIADDLAMSKPSLFYYFPDKQSLVDAVEERIISEYMDVLERRFTDTNSVEEALKEMVKVRMQFLERYFMLADQLESPDKGFGSKTLAEVKQKLKEKEIQLLAKLFEKGIQKKELKPIDSMKIGGLLLDTLSALTHSVRDKKILPEHGVFLEVFEKQKDVMHIFYNGLKR